MDSRFQGLWRRELADRFTRSLQGIYADLIATTGDYLRLWSVNGGTTTLVDMLDNVRALVEGGDRQTQALAESKLALLRAAHLGRLESGGAVAHRHLLHRHDVHNLGNRGERAPRTFQLERFFRPAKR